MPDDVAGFPLRSGARVPTYISLRLRCRHRQYLNGPGRPPSPGIAEGEGRRGSMNESNVADFVQCGAGAVLARAPRGATRERAELDGRARVQGIGEGGPPWPRAALRKASPTASGGPPAEPRPRGADDARVVTSGSAAGSAAGWGGGRLDALGPSAPLRLTAFLCAPRRASPPPSSSQVRRSALVRGSRRSPGSRPRPSAG